MSVVPSREVRTMGVINLGGKTGMFLPPKLLHTSKNWISSILVKQRSAMCYEQDGQTAERSC